MRYTQPQSGPIQIDRSIPSGTTVYCGNSNIVSGSRLASASTATSAGRAGQVVLASGQTLPIGIPVTPSWSLLLVIRRDAEIQFPYFLGFSGGSTYQTALFGKHSSVGGNMGWLDSVGFNNSGFALPLGEVATIGLSFNSIDNRYTWFKNGQQFNSAVGNTTGSGTWQFSAASGEANTNSIALMAVVPRVLDPSTMRSLTGNPWQIFQAPQRRLWAAATSGAQSYSYTASGGAVYGGTASLTRRITRASVGGLAFAGASVRRSVRVVTPVGGIQLSGNAGLLHRAARAAAGGLALAGAATVSFTSSVQSLAVVAAGGVLLRGVATILRAISRRVAGGINLSGAATVTSIDRTAPVRLNLYTIMRADPVNIAADLAGPVNLITTLGTDQANLYTIMRNDQINITAPLGASINLTGNLL